MSILITGAAGFIGAATSRALLERGEAVLGIDNVNDYYDPGLKWARVGELKSAFPDTFSFERADFSDSEALRRATNNFDCRSIIHLGAQPGVRYSILNPEAYIRSNLIGHFNMLEFARAVRPVHMVYASSSSVYGNNKSVPFRIDDRVDHPLSLYAATKKADELLSESYAALYRLPLTGLRFFTVYGPWGRPDMMMWIFTRALYAKEPLPLFNGGDMKRDFTFIDDVARGIVVCLDSPPLDDGWTKSGGSTAPHTLYNIGNNRSEDLLDVVALLERETGCRARIDPKPMQPGDLPETFADISAISQERGFRASTSIEEGVPRFVAWYRQYHGF